MISDETVRTLEHFSQRTLCSLSSCSVLGLGKEALSSAVKQHSEIFDLGTAYPWSTVVLSMSLKLSRNFVSSSVELKRRYWGYGVNGS